MAKFDWKLYKIPNTIVGVKAESDQEVFVLYPNPVGKVLYLRNALSRVGAMQIETVDGKQLISLDHLPESISVEGFPKGVYYITLLVGNTKFRRIFYKE